MDTLTSLGGCVVTLWSATQEYTSENNANNCIISAKPFRENSNVSLICSKPQEINCISIFSMLFQWITLFFLLLYRSLTGLYFWMVFCIKTMTTHEWNCYCLIKRWVVSLRKLHVGGRWRINRRTNDLYGKLHLFQQLVYRRIYDDKHCFILFCGVTDTLWYTCFRLLVMFSWVWKPWWIPITCVLCHFFVTNCSDSSPMRHLLTSLPTYFLSILISKTHATMWGRQVLKPSELLRLGKTFNNLSFSILSNILRQGKITSIQ